MLKKIKVNNADFEKIAVYRIHYAAMKKSVASLIIFGMCVCGSAYAAPAPQTKTSQDDLASFLKRYNVVQPLQQASHSVVKNANALVGNAMGFLGIRYRYGGTSAKSGFDCSGLVVATFQQTLGKLLPRRAADQAAATKKIAKEELRPGDLVFFNTMRRAFSHVGIYVGDGKFIHAPSTGSTVRVDNLNGSYWVRRFNGARRVIEDSNNTDKKKTAAKTTPHKAADKKIAKTTAKTTVKAPAQAASAKAGA